jgi:two-component system CitB family sensor kinase
MKLQTKMILLILSLLLFVAIVGGTFSLRLISSILENQIGSRALKVSQTVAIIPEIRQDLEKGDLVHSRIQEIAEKIRKEIRAQFIVVGDKEGRRYSHPVPERLGQFMVGGDNEMALKEGKSYISRATGTLGPSIRGKVPVFNHQGEVIGIVSVGYLVENVNTIIRGYHIKILSVLTAVILFGIAITIKITNDFKKAIFGLEPREIATLLQERTATLEAIREGIMAIDGEGLITTVNQAAFDTLGLPPDPGIVGKPVKEILPETRMLDVLRTGKSQLDKVLNFDEKEIIVNRIPIITKGRVTGVVSSFRDKDELDILAKKLSQVQKYSELLRVQTHEYSNKLHTISGLIQIGAYHEAIELIGSETSGYQKLINSLMNIVSDPVIAGTILGKYNKARELKIDFQIDPDSSMRDIPRQIKRDSLVTIIGNILDNGFEAVIDRPATERTVKLSMTDLGNDLIFECDDSGNGVVQEIWSEIFSKGYTTKKNQGHGMGLYLVEKAVTRMGGTVSVGSSDLGGAAFTVIIPKIQTA